MLVSFFPFSNTKALKKKLTPYPFVFLKQIQSQLQTKHKKISRDNIIFSEMTRIVSL